MRNSVERADHLRTTLSGALARMEAFAASHESTPEEAHDIRFINGAVNDLLFVLRALVIESGGKAIPNDRLTMARDQVLAALAKWGEA